MVEFWRDVGRRKGGQGSRVRPRRGVAWIAERRPARELMENFDAPNARQPARGPRARQRTQGAITESPPNRHQNIVTAAHCLLPTIIKRSSLRGAGAVSPVTR